jgi:hypothetical protein
MIFKHKQVFKDEGSDERLLLVRLRVVSLVQKH